MKCDVIIPVWNQPEVTKSCLEHLVKNTAYPYRLILIDNGSDEATKKYLESFARRRDLSVLLIRNEKNLGFVKATNQGLRLSSVPYVCIMNNDTIPAPRWLENLVRFAETHPDVGLMNPLCNGHKDRSIEEYARIVEENKDGYMEMNQCLFFCALIKREVINKVGYLDEAFGMGSYDDTDYSIRAANAGYRCVSVHSSYVYHLHSVSFNATGNKQMSVDKGQEAYLKKWPRHLRVGIACSLNDRTPSYELKELLKSLIFLAREHCWLNLWIFGEKRKNIQTLDRAAKEIDMPVHQNIKFNFLSDRFSYAQILARLIERSFGTKRRKKYDFVVVDDRRAFGFLKSFYPVHKTIIDYVGREDEVMLKIKKRLVDFRGKELIFGGCKEVYR